MSGWRTRARRFIFRRELSLAVAQHPLEVGLVVWGALALVNIATGAAPSNALRVLPDELEQIWAALMGLASVTVLVGLTVKRPATIATGMYLYGSTLVAYSAAIIGSAGWHRGGAIAGFLLVIGGVCFLRGWWLKEMEATVMKEHIRNHHED